MAMNARIVLQEPNQVGEARRAAVAMVGRAGGGEEIANTVAVIATEASRNALIHGGGGELLIQAVERDGALGVELLALDGGRGMRDVGACLEDGYSTAGTAGTGLGAIRRMSHQFDVFSAPEQGTVLLSRLWFGAPPAHPVFEVGTVQVNYPGEEVCGDGWSIGRAGDRMRFLVVDGLGHGAGAATAAGEAVRLFDQRPDLAPVETLRRIHDGLRPTRGAVAALCEVDAGSGAIAYAGVGNIVTSLVSPEARQNMVSLNGTLGHQVRTMQAFAHRWVSDALLVMHSDGLGTQWQLERYPGLLARDPAVVAGVLYRDFWRQRDDVTVLVARRKGAG